MPEKIGGGGELEKFSPNDGKYVADGKPNKYYDNPDEMENYKIVSNCFPLSSDEQSRNQNIEKIFNNINKNIKNEQYKKMIFIFLKKFQPQITISDYITIANAGNMGGKIEMNSKNEDYVFFHELGHNFDWGYKEKHSALSTVFTDEENKKLINYMIEDIKESNDRIFDDYNLYLNEELKKEFSQKGYEWISPKEKERKFNEDLEREKKENWEKIWKMKTDANRLLKGKTEEEQAEIIKSDVVQKMLEEFDKLTKRKKELEEMKFDSSTLYSDEETDIHFEVVKRVNKEYASISDAVESLTGGSVGGWGHGYDYWNNDSRQEEFFANCFQSIVMEDDKEIEKYKKYFSRAFNMVNKILNKMLEQQKVEELYGL